MPASAAISVSGSLGIVRRAWLSAGGLRLWLRGIPKWFRADTQRGSRERSSTAPVGAALLRPCAHRLRLCGALSYMPAWRKDLSRPAPPPADRRMPPGGRTCGLATAIRRTALPASWAGAMPGWATSFITRRTCGNSASGSPAVRSSTCRDRIPGSCVKGKYAMGRAKQPITCGYAAGNSSVTEESCPLSKHGKRLAPFGTEAEHGEVLVQRGDTVDA